MTCPEFPPTRVRVGVWRALESVGHEEREADEAGPRPESRRRGEDAGASVILAVRRAGCQGMTQALSSCSLLQALGSPETLWPGARGWEMTEWALPSRTWSEPASVPSGPSASYTAERQLSP